MDLNKIIDLYEKPSDWPKVAAALCELHKKIEGNDNPSIAGIYMANVIENPQNQAAFHPNYILTTIGLGACIQADQNNWYLPKDEKHIVPNHNPDVYHTLDHFREAVIDSIVLLGVYNKAVEKKFVIGEKVKPETLAILPAAMALHDWHRGLGPSEPGYGMELRAAEAFVKKAKVFLRIPDIYLQEGALAILATSPFVAMDAAKTWGVAGATVGNFAFLADKAEESAILSTVPGLVERLRNIHAGKDPQGLLIAQLATCADVLSGTVLGREQSEKNNRRVGIETARATGKDDPVFDDAGLAIAKAGVGFLGYVGQLPDCVDKLTDGAFGKLKTLYAADVARLTSSVDAAPSTAP